MVRRHPRLRDVVASFRWQRATRTTNLSIHPSMSWILRSTRKFNMVIFFQLKKIRSHPSMWESARKRTEEKQRSDGRSFTFGFLHVRLVCGSSTPTRLDDRNGYVYFILCFDSLTFGRTVWSQVACFRWFMGEKNQIFILWMVGNKLARQRGLVLCCVVSDF